MDFYRKYIDKVWKDLKFELNYMTFQSKTSLIFLLIVFIGCSSEVDKKSTKPFANCQYGPPKAIFSKEMGAVTQHDFQLNQQVAIEQVKFDGGIQLELTQSGCEKPRQEFQFNIPTNTSAFKDEDWIAMTIDMFGFMGNMAESLQPFLFWQEALSKKATQIKIGAPLQLESNFFVKIDKVAGEDTGLLIISLFQE